jgi:hypothetical protein
LKTRWSTTHVPVDGKYQTCEMREPVGLNSHMLYYNKMNVYLRTGKYSVYGSR